MNTPKEHLDALAQASDELAAALNRPGQGWVRGIGYHESVAGMLDAADLDTMVDHRPVRIQHRSGRMWFLNSAGLGTVLAGRPPRHASQQQAERDYQTRVGAAPPI